MSSWLSKLLGTDKRDEPDSPGGLLQPSGRLGQIHRYAGNTQFVLEGNEQPDHLIAYGTVSGSIPPEEMKTAIYDHNGIELSTDMGQLPRNQLGDAVKERLNHKFDGKFVAFNSDQQDDKMDVVYVTRKPSDWVDQNRLTNELQEHADTLAAVHPVLRASNSFNSPNPRLSHDDIANAAQDIVDTNLDLQNRLTRKFPTEYKPTLLPPDKRRR